MHQEGGLEVKLRWALSSRLIHPTHDCPAPTGSPGKVGREREPGFVRGAQLPPHTGGPGYHSSVLGESRRGGAWRLLSPHQQLSGCAPSVGRPSIPEGLCPTSRAWTQRGAHKSGGWWGAIAAPPNPLGAPFTAPEHPFLEVSLSPPPISLLPESGGSGLSARLGRSLSVCPSLDP